MSTDAKFERRHDYLTGTVACASFDASTGAARRAPTHSDPTRPAHRCMVHGSASIWYHPPQIGQAL